MQQMGETQGLVELVIGIERGCLRSDWAPMMKYYGMGVLQAAESYCSQFWGLEI